jgi:hypothetical protein
MVARGQEPRALWWESAVDVPGRTCGHVRSTVFLVHHNLLSVGCLGREAGRDVQRPAGARLGGTRTGGRIE